MNYRFCPKCGGELVGFLDGEVNRLKCSTCSFVFYQNSKPCVTPVILQDGKILFARRANEPAKGKWDLPGGFLEAGEHPVDGLRREVKEEMDLDLVSAKFLGIFMDKYPVYDYDTLNIAYICEVKGEPKPNDDVSELGWFSFNNLPELFFLNARETIEVLKKYLKNHGF